MQGGLVKRTLSVYPSVCLSVCQTCGLWQKGSKICTDFYTRRKIIKPSFYRAAWNADAVLRWDFCPSVRLSVKRVHCDKTVAIAELLVWEEEWFVGSFFTWNFGSTGPRWNEIADFEPIFAGSDSAVRPSKKRVQLTLIGSPLHALQSVNTGLDFTLPKWIWRCIYVT